MNPCKTNIPDNSVGIVMPMKDNLKFFKLAFHSILSFTDYPYMLTIVNNMSSLSTEKRLRSMAYNHDITILNYQKDFNYAAEINLGLHFMFKNPGVKYGLILNSDVVVEPYWLSNMVTSLNKIPKAGIIGPMSNMAISEQMGLIRMLKLRELGYVSGFCMLFKRKTFETLGGFEESYVGGCYEDRDFCYRASQQGWKSFLDCSTYIHHFWKVTRAQDTRTESQTLANRNRFFQRFPELDKSKMAVK
jgi:GT2 family glycosyltransferase